MQTLSIETLQDLKNASMGLAAHCGGANCGHHETLDLDMLIERFGTHYRIINEKRIGRSLRCKRCGHKGGSVRLISDTRPSWQWET